MKRILVTLSLLFCLCAPSAVVLAVGKLDIVTHTFASIVKIQFPREGEDPEATGICTGFMVAPRRALTAAHCAPLDAGLTVDGKDAMVIKRDPQFALLSAGNKPALKFARTLKFRDTVTSFGFAWGGDIFVFQRQVAAFKDGDFAVDGALAPGMSGGPTVNQAGEVVGINQGANTLIGIICGAAEIQRFLNSSPR